MIQLASKVGPACVAAALLGACSFDEGSNASRGCDDCPEGMCHLGFCFATGTAGRPATMGDGGAGAGGSDGNGDGPLDAGPGGTGGMGGAGGMAGNGGMAGEGMAGSGGTAGNGEPSEPCEEGDFCYEGPDSTRTAGRCRAGAKSCDGDELRACLGQITPTDETCNGIDDDCDGQIDEDLSLGSCTSDMPGVCAGGTLRCDDGVSVCASDATPSAETCNGMDDDCDGDTDEGTNVPCYPDGADGCTPLEDGGYDCEGACRSGMRVCQAGALLDCDGFVTPADEACDGSITGTGTDEDCDGDVDEDCECLDGAEQECYSGPVGTEGVGICAQGSQTCDDGEFGACMGSIVPAAETCANEGADDDCDGEEDDVLGRGMTCTENGNQGVCATGTLECARGRLVCVTPAAADTETACDGRDEDCDGNVDEEFDLQNDENHCGACNDPCERGETCCGGACVDLASSDDHCGECGNSCGDAMTCCAGDCIDTDADAGHCGGCGIDCSAFAPAAEGEACECAMGACTSPSGPCTM